MEESSLVLSAVESVLLTRELKENQLELLRDTVSAKTQGFLSPAPPHNFFLTISVYVHEWYDSMELYNADGQNESRGEAPKW